MSLKFHPMLSLIVLSSKTGKNVSHMCILFADAHYQQINLKLPVIVSRV